MKTTTKTFGYVRVSSIDQNVARQMDSLRPYVESERDIFADKQSGKDFNRPMYQTLKHTLRSGDTLYIHSLDRLGRNKKQVLEELRYFKENGITVHILDLPTTMMDLTQYGELQGVLLEMINNILIEVLATMAETERRTIHKRQQEGIAAAHRRNIKFGRPAKDLPNSFWKEDYPLWKKGKLTAVYLMKKYNVSSSTFYKKVNKQGRKE